MTYCERSSSSNDHHIVICLGQSLLKDGGVPLALALRIKHAVSVYRGLLSAGSASLYVSGADVAGSGALQPEGALMYEMLLEHGIAAKYIDMDTAAVNTIENARNLIQYIRKRGATAVTLVTSEFHMPRAGYIFKTVLNAENLACLYFNIAPSESGLASGAMRPGSLRPREINDWNFLERIDHETQLMENRMVEWLLSYNYHSRKSDFAQAISDLKRLGESIKRELDVADRVEVPDRPKNSRARCHPCFCGWGAV